MPVRELEITNNRLSEDCGPLTPRLSEDIFTLVKPTPSDLHVEYDKPSGRGEEEIRYTHKETLSRHTWKSPSILTITLIGCRPVVSSYHTSLESAQCDNGINARVSVSL